MSFGRMAEWGRKASHIMIVNKYRLSTSSILEIIWWINGPTHRSVFQAILKDHIIFASEVDVGSNEIPGQSMDHQNYFECPDKYNIAYVFYRETVKKIGEHYQCHTRKSSSPFMCEGLLPTCTVVHTDTYARTFSCIPINYNCPLNLWRHLNGDPTAFSATR